MRFLLLLIGTGEGCDYTIGCNLQVEVCDAADADAAMLYARKWLDDMGETSEPGHDGYRVERASLFAIESETVLPLGEWRSADATRRQEEAQSNAEKRERAEFERLRAKFGDSTR